MARSFDIDVRIGGVLDGSFAGALGGARRTLSQLGDMSNRIGARRLDIGRRLAEDLARPGANLARLHEQYRRLGLTLEQLRRTHEALARSMARGDQLRGQRGEITGEMQDTAGRAAMLAAPLMLSGKVAADFQDQLRDIRITGEMTAQEEGKLGATIRRSAVQFNQAQADVTTGLQTLVAGGIQSSKELEFYAPVIGKTATATRASVQDLGDVLLAFKNNLNIQAKDSEAALNILAKSGKMGQFEIKDMAKWLPTLAPMFKNVGMEGPKAVAAIGAALQIARKGAGTNDAAATNLANFMTKMTAQDTIKDFDKQGINLIPKMQGYIGKGMNPFEASLKIITEAVAKDGPKAAKELQTIFKSTDQVERDMASRRLMEATKLGAFFQDMQVLNFLRPAMANQAEFKDIKDQSLQAGQAAPGKSVIDNDFALRMETTNEQAKQLGIGLREVAITIGSILLPSFNSGVQSILPMVRSFAEFAQANPGVISGVIKVGASLFAFKMATLGVRLGVNLVLSSFNSLRTGILIVSSHWQMLRAMFQLASMGRIGAFFASLGSSLLRFGSLALSAGRMLVTGLLPSLRMVGTAVMWLGRALMLNPIGLVITGIAVAGYLIYRNWAVIKTTVMQGWNWLQSMNQRFFGAGYALIGGLAGGMLAPLALVYQRWDAIKSTAIRAWSMLQSMGQRFYAAGAAIIGGLANGLNSAMGLVRSGLNKIGAAVRAGWAMLRGMAGGFLTAGSAMIMGLVNGLGSKIGAIRGKLAEIGAAIRSAWAMIRSMATSFYSAGADLISGLMNGVSSKLAAAKAKILEVGAQIKSAFTSAMGIQSPSRVFALYGSYIVQGAALGIGRESKTAEMAASLMANKVAQAGVIPALGSNVVAIASYKRPERETSEARRLGEGQAPSFKLLPFAPVNQPVINLPSAMPPAVAVNVPRQDPANVFVPMARPQIGKPASMEKPRQIGAKIMAFTQPEKRLPERTEKSDVQTAARRLDNVSAKAASSSNSNVVVHFSPNITVKADGKADVTQQVQEAVKTSQAEFERMFKRMMQQQERRAM